MKSLPLFWLMVTLLATGCKEKCAPPFALNQLLPNNNPVGGPVMIRGNGFTDNMELFFGEVAAPFVRYGDSILTAQVPGGLAGPVSLSLSQEKCLLEHPFEVLAAFPGNLPASPPTIVIPAQGLSFPIDFASNGSKTIYNVYDPTHWIRDFLGPPDREYIQDAQGNEYEFIVQIDHDQEQNRVEIVADRSGSPFPSDLLRGGYYTLTLRLPSGERVIDNFLVLFSVHTGRQYVFRCN